MPDDKIAANSRVSVWSVPIFVAVVFGVIGCYTVLQHPITENEGPEQTQQHPQEYYRQNCLDCHQDYSSYPYGYFYGVYPDYYFEYPRWGYYYAYPWWWDRHWYGEKVGSEGDSSGAIIPGTKAARRGGLIPPYVEGAPAISIPSIEGGSYRAPNSGASSGKGNEGAAPSGTKPGVQPTKTRVRGTAGSPADSSGQKTKAEEDKKAARRGGEVQPPQ